MNEEGCLNSRLTYRDYLTPMLAETSPTLYDPPAHDVASAEALIWPNAFFRLCGEQADVRFASMPCLSCSFWKRATGKMIGSRPDGLNSPGNATP